MMSQYCLLVSFIVLMMRIVNLRMWKSFPAFSVWVWVSLGVIMSSFPYSINVQSWSWVASTFIPTTLVVLFLAVLSAMEIIHRITLELLSAAMRYLMLALLMVASAVVLSGTSVNKGDFSHWVIAIRGNIYMAIWVCLLITELFLFAQDIKIERMTKVHTSIFTIYIATRAICSGLDLRTGMFRNFIVPNVELEVGQVLSWHGILWTRNSLGLYRQHIWYVVFTAGCFAQSACCIAWVALLHAPRRHWWSLPDRRYAAAGEQYHLPSSRNDG
jgi:hypothetical protein